MSRLRSAFLAALLLTAAPAGAFAQSAAPMDDAQRRAIEGVIRDYLMKNPELILEAVEGLRNREKVAEAAAAKQAVARNRDKLFNTPGSPVMGNPQGDVTVVEFFDYQCGYCKSVHADVQRLVDGDGKVRFVFKEFPILGPGSVTAAKAALASRAQGKYLEVHNALMAHRGQLDDDTVIRLARAAGADVERLKKDMASDEVAKAIAFNRQLGEELGIRGTPGFVIGDEVVPGAIKLDEMKRYVAAARAG